MCEDIKFKVEEIKGYLLDFQRVIDDNYSLLENLHLLLRMEDKAEVSLYHEEIHDLFYGIFSFYYKPTYKCVIYKINNQQGDLSDILVKRIYDYDTKINSYYTPTVDSSAKEKDVYTLKEDCNAKSLYLEYDTNGFDEENIRRIGPLYSSQFTSLGLYNFIKNRTEIEGRNDLEDCTKSEKRIELITIKDLKYLRIGFEKDNYSSDIEPYIMWDKFERIIKCNNKIITKDATFLCEIIFLYLKLDFKYYEKPTYKQYVEKYEPINVTEKCLSDTLPKELYSSDAITIFDKAIEAGYIERNREGYISKFKTKTLLAYFCERMSNKLHLTKEQTYGDGKRLAVSWKPFDELFNTNKIKSGKDDFLRNNTKFKPNGCENIDKLFI